MAKVDQPVTVRNQFGQVMGRKGQDTRARLIAAAVRLISRRSLRELRVADIAREAGLGAPNFYVYFPDVAAAVLAAVEEHPQSSPEVLELLQRDWTSASGFENAHAFVTAYLVSWRENYALLRARNLAADEGDVRFVEQRTKDIGPILEALTEKFEVAIRTGERPPKVRAKAAAGVVLAALERLAAAPRWELTDPSSADDDLRDAAAFVLAAALGLTPRAG